MNAEKNACANCQDRQEIADKKHSIIDNLVTIYNATLFILKMVPNYRVFLRFVRGFFRVNLLKKNQIRFVEIFVTLACNARCDFCSNGLFTKKQGTLTTEKFLDLIDQCADLNVPAICLIGGEPLLYPDLNKLIERIDKRGILSMIASNGYLLNEDKVKELARCGLTNVTISLHSVDEAKHDAALKLPGAFKRIFQARDYCRQHGINFALATVVTHQDFIDGNFEKIVRLAEDNKIALSINPIIPTGFANKLKDQLLSYEDVCKLNEVSKRSRYVSTHLTNNYFGFGCPAGNAYLGVNATGEIFPCFFIPVSLGNVSNMTLREAWDKAVKSPLFTQKHKMCYAGATTATPQMKNPHSAERLA